MPSQLVSTSPTVGQASYRGIDDSGDSVTVVDCVGTVPLVESLRAYLYWWRYGSGAPPDIPSDSQTVAPGDSVYWAVRGAGTYWERFRNSRGLGCAGNRVTVAPDNPTAVAVVAATDRVATCLLFSVQGRRVASLPGTVWDMKQPLEKQGGLASGVYWLKGWTATGIELPARRVIVLR
jgi:hypothetical protein